MVKLRKQRRRKQYNHNRNRKRMRNKQFSEGNVNCKEIKRAWDSNKSLQSNLKEMGICYDPNSTFKIIETRKEKLKKALGATTGRSNDVEKEDYGWTVEETIDVSMPAFKTETIKPHVVEALINDAKAPRAKMFCLPNSQIEFLTEMLTKYGVDFKAMARDKKNYNQQTWKQLRGKVKRFQSIPAQYDKFLASATKATLRKLNKQVQMDEDD